MRWPSSPGAGAYASRVRVTRFGPTTEAMSSEPVTMVRVLAGTSASCSALRSVASRTTAASTPTRPPRPPKMETPPSSTAATTASSSPVALSARALANRNVQKTPASDDIAPVSTNSQNLVRATAMPANAAASALLPIA